MAQTYRTDDVHARDRFAYWREAICDAYVHLGCETGQRAGFGGRISLRELSPIRASFVASDAQHVYRRHRDISRSTDEYFLLSIQTRGIGRVHQHRREAVLNPGDFALYASTDPYELIFDNPFEQLVIQVPKQSVLDRLPIADMLTATAISGRQGAGKLVSDCLVKIASEADHVEPACRSHLSTSVIDLLCSGLPLVNGRAPEDVGRQDQLTTLRIEAFIISNLKNPGLNRADVAAGLNMSVRRINELLAKSGTSISRRIREARLQHIRRELADPARRNVPIGDIALKWGFANLQHFSRVFSSKYGCSPRTYRSAQSDRGKVLTANEAEAANQPRP